MSEHVTLTLGSVEYTRIPLAVITEQLAAQGLHVVTAAGKAVLDSMAARPLHIVTAEAWAVMEAMDALDDYEITNRALPEHWLPVAKAERAKRGLT